jgi:uncharacterized protein (TIGR02266 family)
VSSTAPIRIRLRYAAFDTFIEKFAPNVTRGGVFLASRTPPPVGTTFAFEIQLAGGEVALAGDGKVVWIKPYDPAAPQKPHGMGVQFLRLDAPSRETLNQMLARKGGGQTSGVVRMPAAPGSTGSHRVVGNGNNLSGPISASPSGVGNLGANGSAAARVDTSVDLAAEFGIDESRLRRAVDRNWLAANRAAGELDELEGLLRAEPAEPVSLAQALAEMPRMLDPRTRRMSGNFRPLAEMFPISYGNTRPPAPTAARAAEAPEVPPPPTTATAAAPAAPTSPAERER